MNDRPDLLEKAKSLGYKVLKNNDATVVGKFTLLDPTGQLRYRSDSEWDCWRQAMRYADIHTALIENPSPDLLSEQVANLCHEQWSGWTRYQFAKCVPDEAGNLIIPADLVERWTRQMNTPYAELSESEQNSDRTEAQKFLTLIFGKR